jgi:hypothetical protein
VSSRTSPLGLPLAATAPRVDTHPPYERSLGAAAVALAEAAGLFLDPWQQDSLTTMLAVDADERWVCFEYCELVPRQNGKGAVLEARVLAGFLLFGEPLIMWTAHEYKTAIELFLRLKLLIRRLIEAGEIDEDDVKVNHDNNGRGFELLAVQGELLAEPRRIRFIARSEGSGRGFSGELVIIDEAYAYTPEQQSALMPTMSARPNPQIVYASSPPLKGDSGEILYSLRYRGDPSTPREPGDESWEQDDALAYRDWGLAGDLDNLDAIDLADRANWARTNPALGTRITWRFVEKEFRALVKRTPKSFARERLCVWPVEIKPRAIGGVIPDELWRDLAVTAERPADVAMAIVVNHKRTHTAIAAVGPRADGRMQVSIVDYRPGTHWVVARAEQLRERWNPIGWAVQDKGPSATLIQPLKDAGILAPEDCDKPERGQLAVPWAADVAMAYGLVIDGLAQRSLAHLDEGPLNLAAAGATTRPIGAGTTWDYRAEGAELLQAWTLAHWLYVTWAPLLVRTYDPLANIY